MFLSFFLSFALAANEVTTLSCKLLEDGNVQISDSYSNEADAWAQFNDSYSSIGWGQIHIWSNPESASYNQMYCAGFADAYLTKDRIQEYFYLYREIQTGDRNGKWDINWTNWFSQNINYMRRMTAHPTDDYWKRTALILAQFDGMVAGYKNASKPTDVPISELDFWILQSAGDLDDLGEFFKAGFRDPELTLKCTGLIKILDDYSDVYFAQDTWSDYRELHSYLKEYNLNVPEFKSHRVQVSTRTGHIPSVDDFWTNDQGLLVLETTMHNFNETLYKIYVKPESVLTWIRSYHATFASDNGKEWTENFIRENSGTYNNEYIVLDTKKFTKGEKPQEDFLWMIEQYPGNYRSQDITEELISKSYFPSINTPWFKDLFELADYPGQQKRDPHKAEFWSYEQPRTQIIMRDAPGLSNYEDFKKFMRYNDYKNDDIISRVKDPVTGEIFQEPSQGILSRYDLRPKDGTPYGARNNFGGLDAKTARLSHFMANQSFDAICSPEYDANEPWDFDKWNSENPDKKISHDGLASEYKFPWTEFHPIDYCQVFGGEGDKDKCIEIPGCGFCIFNQQCMMGDKEGPSDSLNMKCQDGWTKKEADKPYAFPLIISVTVIIVVFVTAIFLSAFLPQCKRSEEKQDYKYI